MTEEQKARTNNLIAEKEKTIQLLQNISTELSSVQGSIDMKNRELNSYDKTQDSKRSLEMIASLQDRMSDLEKIILELDETQRILTKEFGLASKGQSINQFLDKKLINEMQEISETNFLKNSLTDRLRFVTIGNITADKITKGQVKEIEINFSYNGRFNRQLYMQTTAGMILPDEVRSVRVNGEDYFRNTSTLKGEFFDKDGKRLIIRDETKITTLDVVSSDEISKKFSSKVDLSKYKTEEDKFIALESEKRGMPESVIISAFGDELAQVKNFADKKAILEELFTEIDRRK